MSHDCPNCTVELELLDDNDENRIIFGCENCEEQFYGKASENPGYGTVLVGKVEIPY